MGAAQSTNDVPDLEHRVLDPVTGKTHVDIPGTDFTIEYDDEMLREIADMDRKRTCPEASWCCEEYPADEYPALCEFLRIDMADACERYGPNWDALRKGFQGLLPERYRGVQFSKEAEALPYGKAKLDICMAEIAEADAFLVGVPDSTLDKDHRYCLPRYVRAAYVKHHGLPDQMMYHGGDGITPDADWVEAYGRHCVHWTVRHAIHAAKKTELERQKGLVAELVGPGGVDAYVTGGSRVFKNVLIEGEPEYYQSTLGKSEITLEVVERARRKREAAEQELETMRPGVAWLARRDTLGATMAAARRLQANADAAEAVLGLPVDDALPELDSIESPEVAAAVARLAVRDGVDFKALLRDLGRNAASVTA
jgi:hypothetical protein